MPTTRAGDSRHAEAPITASITVRVTIICAIHPMVTTPDPGAVTPTLLLKRRRGHACLISIANSEQWNWGGVTGRCPGPWPSDLVHVSPHAFVRRAQPDVRLGALLPTTKITSLDANAHLP